VRREPRNGFCKWGARATQLPMDVPLHHPVRVSLLTTLEALSDRLNRAVLQL